jgi:hypothetical protein
MPIRPENKARYPKDWKSISKRIRERAGDRCEGSPAFPDCRVPNHEIGYRDERGEWQWVADGREFTVTEMREILAGEWEGKRLTRIVLTVAHLDHTPENCADDNLKAMCQRCHLNYDKHHHAQTAYATRKARAQTKELFA